MLSKIKFRLAIVGLLLYAPLLKGQNAKPVNVVTTATPFLVIPADARAGGMGDVGIATSPDANSGFWNLGKIPFGKNKMELGLNYTPWLREMAADMFNTSVSGFFKFKEDQAVHSSIKYFNLGDMQFVDNNGNHLQAFHPREWSIDAGYSRKLSPRSGIGMGVKFIYSNLANKGVESNSYKAGTAFAADLGYYFNGADNTGTGWTFGATLANLGSKIDYTGNAAQKNYIPANVGIGAGYNIALNEQNKVSFAIDINKLLVPTPPETGDTLALDEYRNKTVVASWFSSFGDAPGGISEELKEFQIGAGSEYWYNDQFALRAGYRYENPAKGNRRYFTLGAGIKYSKLNFNFSYIIPSGNSINKSPLANTVKFGLIISE
jgi:hypothetical protein